MTERIADPESACPFVAFDDDRDFRAPVPDHRHRCFAESPAAPRALAHQAAYCLSSAFPGCPTFVDWARREAAPPKVESPVRSLRDEGASPRPTSRVPVPIVPEVPGEQRPTPPADDWSAPPPWGAAADAAAGAAAGAAAAGATLDAAGAIPGTPEPADAPPAERSAPAAAAPGAGEPPAFLAGRGQRPGPAMPEDQPRWAPPEDDVEVSPAAGGAAPRDEPWSTAERPAEPAAARPSGPARVPVGYTPVGYAPVAPQRSDRRAGGGERDRQDAAAPSWEQPRRFEAYPSLKSRGSGGLPRPALYALIVLLVGVGLFATPFVLRGLGGDGGAASTPSPSASSEPTAEPTATPEPTPSEVVYIVKANDTLSKIATKYGVTVDQILKANPSIKNPNRIAVGDQIVIPQPLPSEIVDGEITPAP